MGMMIMMKYEIRSKRAGQRTGEAAGRQAGRQTDVLRVLEDEMLSSSRKRLLYTNCFLFSRARRYKID